jgi:uncharacterized protein YodC (DUF2158 family)
MIEPTFKPGDIVYLKSGSPPLVVDCVFGDNSYQVRWMRKGRDQSATFGGMTLTTKQPKF